MSRTLLSGLLVALIVGLVVANWLLHGHAAFPLAEVPGFHVLLTLVTGVCGVALASLLRRVAKRRETDDE